MVVYKKPCTDMVVYEREYAIYQNIYYASQIIFALYRGLRVALHIIFAIFRGLRDALNIILAMYGEL